ncbi:iron transporter [Sphingomonas sp. MMS12-HWE2-04]|uniref:iron transporter n=1 Tax=Sphingomonas sp. MMS12-HWE2-04 TaxID=3234199 RepID=UPI00384C07DF
MARHGGQLTLGYRLAVTSRVLAGTLGAYAVASLAAIAIGPVLPLARNEAVTSATLVAVLVWVGAILWAFGARTALRAWLGLGGAAALLALGGWMALR